MIGSKWTQEAYLKAFLFAARAHDGQVVPGKGLPYLAHIAMVAMEVTASLTEEQVDGDFALQCALLHDVIEDTETTFKQIETAFGLPVAQGVLALSKDPSLAISNQLADSLNRVRQQPREVWVVKLADRITNLQPPPAHWSSEKIARYSTEAREILSSLGSASNFLAQRLARKIEQYKTYGGK